MPIGTNAARPYKPGGPMPFSIAAAPGLDLGSAASPDQLKSPMNDAFAREDLNQTIDGLQGMPKRNLGQRIDDFLKQPGMAGALLRSAGATLDGGLGAGIAAGTGYMDQRAANERNAMLQDRAFGLDERRVSNQERDTTGNLVLRKGTLDEQVADRIQRGRQFERNIQSEEYRHRTPSGDRLASEVGANYRNDVDNRTRRYGIDVEDGNSDADRDLRGALGWAGVEVDRYNAGTARAGIGSKSGQLGTRTITEVTPGSPAVNRWFGADTPATPERRVVTEVPIAPSQVQPEVRYDGAGRAYVQGPNGQAVPAPQYDRR